MPHPPQFPESTRVSTQAPLQFERPPLQEKPQLPPEHVATAESGALHALPQLPQLVGSDLVSTHAPWQSFPESQLAVHAPPEQLPLPFVGDGQLLLHEPQLAASAPRSTHADPHSVSGA